MSQKYTIWIKEKPEHEIMPDNHHIPWVEQGDGPVTHKQAYRISREIGHLVHSLKMLPVGDKP